MNRRWTRRSLLKSLGATPLLLGLPRASTALAQAREPVRFLLDWTWWQPQIPLMVAKEKGFFDKAGLDVELRQGNGSGSTCQIVGQGTYDIGNVNLTTAAQYISKGIPIRAVADIAPRGASALVYKAGALTDVKDIVGKRIGSTPGGSDAQILPAFFKKANIDPKQVTIVNLPGDAKLGALLTGQIDLLSGDGYYYSALAAEKGFKLGQFLFADFGANTIGYGLVANRTFIDKQPDRIRRFVAAVLDGYKFTSQHIDESIAIYKKISQTDQNDQVIRDILTGYLALVGSPEAKGTFSGRNDPEVWKGTLDILATYGGLTGSKNPDDYFTNQFVPNT